MYISWKTRLPTIIKPFSSSSFSAIVALSCVSSPTMSSFTAPGQFRESTATDASHYEALISSMRKINSVLVNSIVDATGLLVRFGSWSGFGFGRGGDGGNWWRFLSQIAYAREEGREWDAHGVPVNILLQLSKLSAFRKYKISEILFFDRLSSATAGTEDSFFEMVSLRAGGVYTKAQLQKELESLATCGMFEKVDMEGKTNPDGTIGLTISFLESTWLCAKRFRCINVGLMKPVDIDQQMTDEQMTDEEMIEAFKNQDKDYKRRIESSRPCLLPASISKKVMKMLKAEGKVSARSLQKIRDRVQKWYHDEGYACAQVVCFGNLNMKEIVCEVLEGDITQLVIQFQDKLGNVVKGNTNLHVVCRELPKQLRQGHVFNIEAGKQALRNIDSLALFSNIDLIPKPDGKNEGGIIVEITLKEFEQKTGLD